MVDSHEPEASMVRRCGQGRIHIEITIDALSEHNLWCDLSMDMQGGGVFIATHQPLRLGTVVELSLRLPDAPDPFAISGVVRWTRTYFEGSDGAPGVGVALLSPDDDVRDRLGRFAQTVRDPILFELDEAPMRRRHLPSRPPPAPRTSAKAI